jgi:hypothetical protein
VLLRGQPIKGLGWFPILSNITLKTVGLWSIASSFLNVFNGHALFFNHGDYSRRIILRNKKYLLFFFNAACKKVLCKL